jgi:hypothetical protein
MTLRKRGGQRAEKVWQNWPGALELLLAAQAKEVSVAWLDDAASQLRFCAAS